MCSNRRMGVLHLCLGHYDTPTDQPNNQKADMMVKKVVTIPLSFRGRDGEIRICSIFLLQRYALLIIFELQQIETKSLQKRTCRCNFATNRDRTAANGDHAAANRNRTATNRDHNTAANRNRTAANRAFDKEPVSRIRKKAR